VIGDHSALRFFELTDLEVVEGSVGDLIEQLRRRGSSRATVTVFRDLAEDSWHVLSVAEVVELHLRTLALRLDRLKPEQLVDALPFDPGEPGMVVGQLDRPDQPAVVLDAGRVTGAWAPAATSGEHAEHAPQGAPPPGPIPDDVESAAETTRVRGGEPIRGDEAAPMPAAQPALRRTPHLDAPDALPTAKHACFKVGVRLDNAPFAEREQGEELVLELPPDVDRVTVGVLVSPSAHFTVDGSPYQPLEVERDREDAGPLEFALCVTSPDAPGAAGITALFVYNGRPCGSVTRRWSWDPTQPQAPPAPAQPGEPAEVHLDTQARQPDLSVYVTRPVNDGIHFSCSVQTPLLAKYREPTPPEEWALPQVARSFVAAELDRIISGGTPGERRSALIEAGVAFWKAAPSVFQRVLFELIDAGLAPKNIYISSAEPSLPWELMVPSSTDADGIAVDREPLGVEFAIGRWIDGGHRSPSQHLVVTRGYVVAPEYDKPARAIDASIELDCLTDRLGARRIDPAAEADLDAAFAAEPAELVHFVCHGASGDGGDVLFLDHDKPLRASTVRVKDSFKSLCRQGRPLVFINACDAAQLSPSIGGADGFPSAFAELGARAVIAPLWSVLSGPAGHVAAELYERALDEPGHTLAELVRDVRARAYRDAEFDDSFAAYCLYGDPLTVLERGDASDRSPPTAA
jgi:hypothetical protein